MKILLFSCCLFILFDSCTSGNQKIILAENVSPLSSLSIVAHEKGFFQREGLDVQVSKFTSGKLALDAVLGDQADIATVAETPLVFAALKDQPFHVLGTIFYSDNACKIVARTDNGIKTVSDLKDHKIATFFGTNAQYFLDTFLRKNNLNPKTMNILNLSPTDMLIALNRKDIDAYAVWEPYIARASRSNGSLVQVFDAPGLYTTTFNLVIGQKFYEKFGTEETLRFLQALKKTAAYIQTNPKDAIEAVAKYTGIEGDILTDIWKSYDLRLDYDEARLKGYLEAQTPWAKAQISDTTLYTKQVDYTKNFDSRFFKKLQ
jgi:ABC-type nitrate/sulfonate/bicarbonate transport system substrate-binding protein